MRTSHLLRRALRNPRTDDRKGRRVRREQRGVSGGRREERWPQNPRAGSQAAVPKHGGDLQVSGTLAELAGEVYAALPPG